MQLLNRTHFTFIFLCLAFIFVPLHGEKRAETTNQPQQAVRIDESLEKIQLGRYIEVLTVDRLDYTIEDIASAPFSDQFEPFTGKGRPNYGYNVKPHWVRVLLENNSTNDVWLLELEAPKVNELHFYTYNRKTQEYDVVQTGNNYPFNERQITHRNFVYPIELKQGETKEVYLFIYTGSSVQIPLTLWDQRSFLKKSLIEYSFLGVLIGLSVIMALYNLFLYFSIRDISYLYYVLFVLLNTLLYVVDTGLDYQFLWPHLIGKKTIQVTELMYLSNIGGLLFIRSFLSTHKRMPKADFCFKLLILLNVIGFIIRQFTFAFSVYAATALVLLSIFLILYFSASSLFAGFRPARYLLIAWGFFLLGVFISLMVDVGIIPLTMLTKYAWQITTSLEILLLSFALGDKYKTYREEKERAIREANEAQQKALENLRRTDKLKDEFLSITSHELRTPLNGIIGIAETMRAGAAGKIDSQVDAHLAMITKSGNRLFHLIDDLTDYANLKNDQLKMQFKSVRLYEVCSIVLTICEPLVTHKRIRLINNIAPDKSYVVYADPNRLQQILYNLVGNAIKFTDAGEITVGAKEEESFIRIDVSDTGKGIPAEKIKNIFNEFYQVDDGATRQYEGSGIGLNVTKRLIENHGGQITVHSIEREGSTFSFTIPKYTGERVELEIAPTSQLFVQPDVNEHNRWLQQMENNEQIATILIADDDLVNLQVLMNQLHLAGYDVITATNGFEVFELIETKQIDLLILDIMMPKLSGYEVCRQLREKYTILDLPILMLTAKSQLHDQVMAFEIGANDYLTKPCDRHELTTRVKTLVKLSKLNKEIQRMQQSLEEQVEQRTKELQIANRHLKEMAKSRRLLLSNIAHDLGTPVTVIHNYLEILETGIIEEGEKDQYLQLAYSKINVLKNLIHDLFNLSILEEKQLNLNKRKVTVDEWGEQVRQKIKAEIISANRLVSYVSTVAKNTYIAQIDELRMEQVFSNLIWNAINHTKEKFGKIDIHVTLSHEEDKLIISIADNGSGIEEKMMPFIFERYYKGPVSNEKGGGTGVGLAIVKEIVEAHNGKVWAKSGVKVGTVFFVSLPIERIDELNVDQSKEIVKQ
ncbi:MAG TPA: ATP-binding protein [Pseudogracilibacillus sp.]|nr:ATP-binding protein [Pseudogracilibacillus sp.]